MDSKKCEMAKSSEIFLQNLRQIIRREHESLGLSQEYFAEQADVLDRIAYLPFGGGQNSDIGYLILGCDFLRLFFRQNSFFNQRIQQLIRRVVGAESAGGGCGDNSSGASKNPSVKFFSFEH